MWYEPGKKWMMTLAVKDHINFYSSPDLKSWAKKASLGKMRVHTVACGNVLIYSG